MKLDVMQGLARARSWGKCEGCGTFGVHLDVHHRQARGAGGVYRRAAEIANDIRNGLCLCRTCHDKTEHADTWTETEDLGWRIPKWVDDPLVVPAYLHTINGVGWYLLTPEGGYKWQDLPSSYRLDYGTSPESESN